MARVNNFVRSYVNYLNWRDNTYDLFYIDKGESIEGGQENILACALQPQ